MHAFDRFATARRGKVIMQHRRMGLALLLFLVLGTASFGDLYRDWGRRLCPVLDTPHRTYRGFHVGHILGSGTGTTGWGDNVSVTDLHLWGRLPSLENDLGGELELRGHTDLRVLEGFSAGSGLDRTHGFMMLHATAIWHQRFLGGFGMQARLRPGVYAALSKPAGNVFALPVGLTLVQAFHPDLAVFAGADYYPEFDVEVDPVFGLLYTQRDSFAMQLAYPHSKLAIRPYGGRFQMGMGADVVRWPEYRLGSGDDRRSLRFRENRAYATLSWDTRGFTQIDLQMGYVFGRKAIFPGADTIEFEDAPFVSLGFSAIL
jgi:hypothetical protein